MSPLLYNDAVDAHFKQYIALYCPNDMKSALENFIRRELFVIYDQSRSFEHLQPFLEFAFSLANESKIDQSVPFLMIEDIVELGSFELLSSLLPYLDRKADEWTSKLSSKKGNGLILLRTVNLMRRKTVRSEHAKLAGMALLLLSKIFPVNERSGLNLKGDRNTDNVNLKLINENSENIHKVFWSLHATLYTLIGSTTDHVKSLQSSIDIIFEKFEAALNQELHFSNGQEIIPTSDLDFFTPQYLVDNDSLSKQISDGRFRLAVLTQILVALQDLSIRSSPELCKTSKPDIVLDEKQEHWINESTKKAFLLISKHANGSEYFRFLRHVIKSEKNWIKWKSISCPDFEKDVPLHRFESDPTATNSTVDLQSGDGELCRLWKYDKSAIINRRLRPDLPDYLGRYTDSESGELVVDANSKWRIERLKWKTRF